MEIVLMAGLYAWLADQHQVFSKLRALQIMILTKTDPFQNRFIQARLTFWQWVRASGRYMAKARPVNNRLSRPLWTQFISFLELSSPNTAPAWIILSSRTSSWLDPSVRPSIHTALLRIPIHTERTYAPCRFVKFEREAFSVLAPLYEHP